MNNYKNKFKNKTYKLLISKKITINNNKQL